MTMQLNVSHSDSRTVTDYSDLLSDETLEAAFENIRNIPGYQASPLLSLEALAKQLSVARVSCKYEGERLGGSSFKLLGVAHAVIEVAKRHTKRVSGESPTARELFSGQYRSLMSDLTLTCATSGNHGFALAWIARELGANCIVYSPDDMSRFRKERIAALGAEVVVTTGGFDMAVQECSTNSSLNGHIVISNLVQEGYEDVPQLIMNGYSILAREVLDQVQIPLTHVFVGGGGGRLAASLSAFFKLRLKEKAPRVVVVEPENSSCIHVSLDSDELTAVKNDKPSLMTGLVVSRPSSVAWPILREEVFATLTISDQDVIRTLVAADQGALDPALLPIGETGIAALAGFIQVMKSETSRQTLGIDDQSHVLVVACEGVTDPALLESLLELGGISR